MYWATFAPLRLCPYVESDNGVESILPIAENHPNWQLHVDILNHPPQRLAS